MLLFWIVFFRFNYQRQEHPLEYITAYDTVVLVKGLIEKMTMVYGILTRLDDLLNQLIILFVV